MGTNLSAPKKQRNYLIDLYKFLFSILVVVIHSSNLFSESLWGVSMMSEDGNLTLNPKTAWSYSYGEYTEIFGLDGHLTIAVFIFLTGYWLVNEFKKHQKAGVVGKGKDMALIAKYAAKTYATYWPYTLFAVALMFVTFHTIFPELRDLKVIVSHFVTAIPQWLGLFQFGDWSINVQAMDIPNYTELLTISSENLPIRWYGPCWYMWAFIVCGPLYYAIMVMNERFATWVFAPLIYTLYFMTSVQTGLAAESIIGLHQRHLVILGPMTLGIWGWYITDWLKKVEITKKGKIGLTVFSVVMLFSGLFCIKTGYCGMCGTDFVFAFVFVLALAQRDYLSIGLNNLLNKISGVMKYAGTASLALFLIHFTIQSVIVVMSRVGGPYEGIIAALRTIEPDMLVIYEIVVLLILTVPFYFIEKYWLKPLSAWVIRITKATEPVVIEAPKAEA